MNETTVKSETISYFENKGYHTLPEVAMVLKKKDARYGTQ